MQEISRFYGISVSMGNATGKEPFFHAYYEDSEMVYATDFSIETLEDISGVFPPTGTRLIKEWAVNHKKELMRNWQLAKDGKPLLNIKPLDAEIKARQPKWVVKSVKPRENYTLLLTFEDGKKGIYDVKPLLKDKIFEPLKDMRLFMLAHMECSTVVWNDELDIAPEELYDNSTEI